MGTLYDYPSLAVALTVPTTAKVGQPVTVTVTTAGSGNCTRAAGATVAIEGLIADIVPLDATPDPASGAACWRDMSAYPRPVQLTFLVPGEAHVRATGLRLTGDTGLVTTEATIQVEP